MKHLAAETVGYQPQDVREAQQICGELGPKRLNQQNNWWADTINNPKDLPDFRCRAVGGQR